MDWFLYDRDLRLKRVKDLLTLRRQEYLGLHQKSIIEIFCKNSERFLAINYFCKKAPLLMFHNILSTFMISAIYFQ